MRFTSLFLLLFIPASLYSQKILLDKDISKAYKKIQGPNTKSFGQVYLGTGFIFSGLPDQEISIKTSGSRYFSFGYRQKFKVFNFYAMGFEIEYFASQFSLKQSIGKLIPNSEIHDKEKIKLHNAAITYYNRFNIGKRGNVIGKFIDIGGFLNYAFNVVHYTKDNIAASEDLFNTDAHAKVVVTKNSRLDYIQPIQYGVYCRVGIDWFALKLTYRFSDIFKDKYNWNELPRLYAGFEISFPN